jgi:DNA replication and repair protein RecF
MHISSVSLRWFRSYEKQDVEFPKGITVLSGANAQGKTNMLEALFLCSAARSHRVSSDREMVMSGKKMASVKASFFRSDGKHTVDITLIADKGKRILFDDKPVSRLSQFVGQLSCVMFSPDDMRMVKDGPDLRRRFMDIALCQVRPAYLSALQHYNRALTQRNTLLRTARYETHFDESLTVWDAQLVAAGETIIQTRKEFISKLAPLAAQTYEEICGGGETLTIEYAPSVLPQDNLSEVLKQGRETDLRRAMTTRGPHRDELHFEISGRPARVYASQGQQRTAALALKIAELHYLSDEQKQMPVLLLDDVFSELDSNRKRLLLPVVAKGQCVITCTEAEALPLKKEDVATHYIIEEGRVINGRGGEGQ